ncbi:hypothetical protein ACLMJK_001971 [Lecanora helva]
MTPTFPVESIALRPQGGGESFPHDVITAVRSAEVERCPSTTIARHVESKDPEELQQTRQLCTFTAALDQVVVATAIPTITHDLHSAAGYTWIGGTYLLAKAASSPIWTKISDIWGRKPVFLTTIFAFAVTSAVCAASASMTMLIVGRACQGTAAGGLLQLVNVTISDLFSMRERTLWLGLLECVWAVAGGAGPILGGAFTELISWRWGGSPKGSSAR